MNFLSVCLSVNIYITPPKAQRPNRNKPSLHMKPYTFSYGFQILFDVSPSRARDGLRLKRQRPNKNKPILHMKPHTFLYGFVILFDVSPSRARDGLRLERQRPNKNKPSLHMKFNIKFGEGRRVPKKFAMSGVRPSVRLSVRPSVHPSVCPSVRPCLGGMGGMQGCVENLPC